MYERITICIYGLPITGPEGIFLLDTARNDVPLEKIALNSRYDSTEESNTVQGIVLTNEDEELLRNYNIDSLISPYIKCEVIGGLKKAYYINPPNLNMIEKTKTGYIYYENDLNYYCQSLYNFYCNGNKHNTSAKYPINITNNDNFKINFNDEVITNVILFQTFFKKINNILKVLISNNSAFLEDDCVFSQNSLEIYNKFPEILVDLTLFALQGKIFGHSEIKIALKMLKILANSHLFASKFIDKGLFDIFYTFLLNKDHSSILIAQILEIIYTLITFNKAFNKLLENIDKTRQEYFMVKEVVNDGYEGINKEKEIIKNSNGDKYKSKDKKSNKKSKKSSKRDSFDSRNKSNSDDTDNSYQANKRRNITSNLSAVSNKQKNVLLKNGYQIIITLILQDKKNSLVNNIIKKIMSKVAFLLYLKELSNFTEVNKFKLKFLL